MPYAYKMLAQGQSTSAALTTFNTVYTVPAGKSVIINKIDVFNNGGNGGSVSFRIVPSGATPGATHVYVGGTGASAAGVINQQVLKSYTGPITLSAGDFIQMSSEFANAFNYFIFGIEIS